MVEFRHVGSELIAIAFGEIAGDDGEFLRRIVEEIQPHGHARFGAGIGVEEFGHFIRVSGEDEDEFVAIALHCLS